MSKHIKILKLIEYIFSVNRKKKLNLIKFYALMKIEIVKQMSQKEKVIIHLLITIIVHAHYSIKQHIIKKVEI